MASSLAQLKLFEGGGGESPRGSDVERRTHRNLARGPGGTVVKSSGTRTRLPEFRARLISCVILDKTFNHSGPCSLTFFFFFWFVGLHLQHMGVPRLGKLSLLPYTTATGSQPCLRPTSQLGHCQILNTPKPGQGSNPLPPGY